MATGYRPAFVKTHWSTWRAVLAIVMTLLATGCAQQARVSHQQSPQANAWSGRLSLQVDDPAAQPLNAGFELRGQPAQGELTLLNPFGNVIAKLIWSPGRATLTNGNETRESDSLDTLVLQLTGSTVPVTALFGWLRQEPAVAEGWDADLEGMDRGRLVAYRRSPLPQATLRIALDR
ncbi:lipoprotein insertase outer membrane protein LolB [Acidovorax sp. SUPP3334]|uniref:lipoprotein insertase outer membrane protein LolB n=1 Tax=Acidovorax sp. SUPP3334 TaxID=2920881 RepID=UPI0023DE30A3|nr:lipoprotein insertase outer membrane protein LolB [Acidovorax sp. SUPP3334]GKT20406.1 outer membrane lipoprotein LolB [Acidovorax sp. SUPP3334]